MIMMVFSGLIVLACATNLVYMVVSFVMGVSSSTTIEVILPYGLLAILIWGWHYGVWKKVELSE